MFNREIIKDLMHWKASEYRKPLVLRGARQVGKTTVVNQFAVNFSQYIYTLIWKLKKTSKYSGNVLRYTNLSRLFFL